MIDLALNHRPHHIASFLRQAENHRRLFILVQIKGSIL